MADPAKPPLPGPDLLTDGIPLADLADGATATGHALGEPVLLARRGEEIFAISAKCSHLGAPLGKGLLVDDTVRCPWHHACFSLRTGEALRAPALDPLPCWTVTQRDGRAFVTGKQTRDPLAPVGPTEKQAYPVAVVIIGAGAAGSAAAEMLRREGYEGSITMLDGEAEAPYDRTMLSKSFPADEKKPVSLRPADFYALHNIELVRGEVSRIEVPGRRVLLADGAAHAYDRLLLATGASPLSLDIPGHDLPHVHVLRSLADHHAIATSAAAAKRAVVLGASFIGLEVAAALRTKGLEVHVVAPDELPLAKVLGPELGEIVRKLHQDKGVFFHLEQKATRIEADAVTLENGDRLPADLVVAGIGVRPRLALAETAGLALDKGVSVNEYLETSAPGVFAAGDIARWPDPHSGQNIRVEHWVVAQRQGQTAARNMLGQREKFEAVPFFWSKHYDLSVRYVGHAEKWDEAQVSGDLAKQEFSIAYKAGGKTMAVASVKRDVDNLKAEVALEADDADALAALLDGEKAAQAG
ncbi:FAD-dependent oxidoreductase [Hymenobacter properus]|uniref:FAD-dependent oxidoreductase n=1 Tax=Hymenobacter properus TaxID=2791026 RepID=A0A931FLB7_9BACT|nr:FAD-dependent oxidoreductase [Hymenobacter properus]MBF9140549.1 FAD-dependent oxidoreductase [Hymenobacter properus]MBR7719356.1 FAD-dependent oxidoreductase [Microvirga sp. SRT04]